MHAVAADDVAHDVAAVAIETKNCSEDPFSLGHSNFVE